MNSGSKRRVPVLEDAVDEGTGEVEEAEIEEVEEIAEAEETEEIVPGKHRVDFGIR